MSGRKLEPLAAFREFSGWPDSSPSIHGAIGKGPGDPAQRRVALYLVQATVVTAVMEMVPDVVDGEAVYLGAGWRSDGDWFWRGDLPHYVLKYNLGLAPEFLEHAARWSWAPGRLADEELTSTADIIRRSLK